MKINESITLKNIEGFYWPNETFIINKKYLGMLVSIFDEGSSWTNAVQKELLNPNSRGITGNRVDIGIQKNMVIIKSVCFDGNEIEDNAIEIDKKVLLALINKWQQLAKKDAQEITLTHHEDGTISIEGSFEKQ